MTSISSAPLESLLRELRRQGADLHWSRTPTATPKHRGFSKKTLAHICLTYDASLLAILKDIDPTWNEAHVEWAGHAIFPKARKKSACSHRLSFAQTSGGQRVVTLAFPLEEASRYALALATY